MDIKNIIDKAPIGATHYAVLRGNYEVASYVAYEKGVYWIIPNASCSSIDIKMWKVYPLIEMKAPKI
ncbi:hypothetical protein [Aliivibrio fischeri]|uniref:hypothetical protein n=1 Tax=Aliivibrio fischeri TaxID=668 RepID=UPI000907DFAA|nr:hypothetical protein [Aliivibrio fischeri]